MAIKTEFEIEFACGHTETRDLSHKPAGDRAGFAQWLASTQCRECFEADAPKRRKEFAKQAQAEEREEATEAAQRMNLPELTGTDKQIRWALVARHRLITVAVEDLTRGEDAAMDEDAFEERIMGPARKIVRAGWWIDNRNAESADLEELMTDVSDDAICENDL